MKTPVVIVTVTLTVAIVLAATFLIATGTRGEEAVLLPRAHPPIQHGTHRAAPAPVK